MATALSGGETWFTDQADMLPFLQKNIDSNLPHTPAPTYVTEFEWDENGKLPEDIEDCGPFDYILCADLVYNEHILGALVAALEAVTSPHSVVLFSMELRTPLVHRIRYKSNHLIHAYISHSQLFLHAPLAPSQKQNQTLQTEHHEK